MRERKNLMAAILLVAAFLMATLPIRAEEPARRMREASPGTAWVVQLLDWLGLRSVQEMSSAYIDPNGHPTLHPGGGPGASASPDDSAYIDPNG
jgi:hypothetical protein